MSVRDCKRDYMRRKRKDPAFLETQRQKARDHRARHPEYHRIITASRRAQELGVVDTLTLAEWEILLEQHGRRCAYCFAPFATLDHVVDMSKGGANSAENVVPACADCNWRKGHATGWVPSIASSFWPPDFNLVPA